MNITTISATEARNRWFEILNLVYFKGEEILIEKNKTPIVKLSPVSKPNLMSIDEFIKATRGYLKGKKGSFPYQDNKNVIAREQRSADRLKAWKHK